jgi:hypothetical protein
LDQDLPKGWRVERMRVPAAQKKRIRYELYRLGVHESALFPDMDGLAARIRYQFTVKEIREGLVQETRDRLGAGHLDAQSDAGTFSDFE